MSATNSPVFDSNMDSTNQSSQDNNPVVSQNSPKITKKQEKENERAAKKQAKEDAKKAKEDAKKAKEDAKKAKEDAKKAKEDEKAAKKQAAEDAKKGKEDAKKAKEDEKAAKKLARENKKNNIPTEVSNEVSNEVSTEVSNEVSTEVPIEVPIEVSNEVSNEVSTEVSNNVSTEVSNGLVEMVVGNPPFGDIETLKTLPPKSLKLIEFSYFLIRHFEKSLPSLPIDSLFELAHTFQSPSSQSSFLQNFFDNHKLIHADLSRIKKSSNSDLTSRIVHNALSFDSNDLPISTHPFSFNDQHFLIDNLNNLYHLNLHTHIGKWDPNNSSISLF